MTSPFTTGISRGLLRHQAYINGHWQSAADGRSFSVLNPANGDTIAEVSDLSGVETEQAIQAAAEALPAWRKHTAKQRSQILQRWFQLIMQNQAELAELLSLEQGKPQAEAMGKSPTVPVLSNGLPKRESELTAKQFRHRCPADESARLNSQWVWWLPLHHGTSPTR